MTEVQPRSARAARRERLVLAVPELVVSVEVEPDIVEGLVVVVVVSVVVVAPVLDGVVVVLVEVAGAAPMPLVVDCVVVVPEVLVELVAGSVVVVPGAGFVAFGVVLVLVLVEDVCANATPATREAAAAAIVKLFGSLVISDLLLQCESTVAMGCPLQRSAVICRCAKRLGRV